MRVVYGGGVNQRGEFGSMIELRTPAVRVVRITWRSRAGVRRDSYFHLHDSSIPSRPVPSDWVTAWQWPGNRSSF